MFKFPPIPQTNDVLFDIAFLLGYTPPNLFDLQVINDVPANRKTKVYLITADNQSSVRINDLPIQGNAPGPFNARYIFELNAGDSFQTGGNQLITGIYDPSAF